MAKSVIITGVTGQTGSYMVEYLLKNTDLTIFGVARRSSTANLRNLANVVNNPRFTMLMGDLSDSQSIDGLVKQIKPDYFINFGAQSFVGASWKIPEQTFDVDAIGVIRCLEAVRNHAPHCRFYNAGSSEEYGDVVTVPQNENHPLRARSPYGAAKVAARQVVKVWRESYGLYAVQGILFNHESERRGEDFVTRKITKGVARIKKVIEAGEDFEPIILGNLDARRDWSHAEDFVDGVWRMLNQEIYNPELASKRIPVSSILLPGAFERGRSRALASSVKEYVLSSNETHSIREFIEKAFHFAEIPFWDANADRVEPIARENAYQINYVTAASKVPLVAVSREFYRPAEVNLLHGDSTAARKELGWNPRVSFDELVRRMVHHDINLLTQESKTS